MDKTEKDRKREKERVIRRQKEEKEGERKRQKGNQEAIETAPRIQEGYCKI